MDRTTVVILLSLHLVVSGGLMYFIARRARSNEGLHAFAIGAGLFGLGYAVRLATGFTETHAISAVPDTMMVLALLMFMVGLRRHGGRGVWSIRGSLAFGVACLLLQSVVIAQAGEAGRHIALNGVMGLMCLALGGQAAADARRLPAELAPRRVMAVVVGMLGLATLARSAAVAVYGIDSLFHGPGAQAYYGYSSMAALVLCPVVLWMIFLRLNLQLAALASRDALTHVLNRNGLDEALRRHFGSRQGPPLAWLVVDIDHFKRINDEHGHAAGDAVLREVARALQARVRAGDFVARTGGEEFLIGCTGASRESLRALGERVRGDIEALRVLVPGGGEALRCTASVGLSTSFDQLAAWEAAAREADGALYRAKALGRNRVEG